MDNASARELPEILQLWHRLKAMQSSELQSEGPPRLRSALLRYGLAAVLIGAAVAASKASASFLHIEPFVSLFLCAIILSAWAGGIAPGLFATGLAAISFDYFVLLPIGSFAMQPNEVARLGMFLLVALFVNWMSAKHIWAARTLHRSRQDLLASLERQKLVEARLLRSEMYLAEAQRLSHTGSFGWKITTDELYWSQETFRIFGYEQTLKPTPGLVLERVHPDDRARVQQTIEMAGAGGKELDHEYRLLMRGGEVRYVRTRARAVADSDGGVELIGAVTDITETKQIEMDLRTSQQRFRDFAETASDWFWETDQSNRLSILSREAKAIRVGSPAWKCATDLEEEAEKWQNHFKLVEAHQPFRDFVFRVALPDGTHGYTSVSGKPLFGAGGGFLGYRGVASDITATIRREHAETALRDAQAELAHAARVIALGELTTSIAHEVNQPLTAIMSNAEVSLRWLDRGVNYLDRARQSIEWIVKDVNRAAEVIGRVRALARKAGTGRVAFDLNEVVTEVSALLQREMAENKVELKLNLSGSPLMVCADRIQLQQVIMNLLMNGIEAMQPVSDRARELLLKSECSGSSDVLVVVEDCGIGIAADNLDKLFDAFFSTKSSGLGLGLSICRTIIESHGGRLSATQRPEFGATFQFTLPLRPQ
ncbi:ATP-binding protein [Bradyrhizobium elkanii]|uniref:ATP-binding protein n=1 Tax=Bradyrhizobium elkanii TaxID=29448 RepID=UPI002167797A|nr:ATP-binding protein [Bradyrhizobium elkanii]MCS3522201.1 PAS domain S-box-containing protein [Bradyrhizobium elkanii]MCS4069855.1 PAS domain S-box-containing protein [Bradyrhizobium elkanii]MCS4076486.1 PAS domain S-box-containing protein [Bradyrhizobium elkanii]MCW2124956.1 PAS domain S-box-containing protein [Bradyrhizobium elkanii]MCW2171702.1 PAS domain S-box-containing protein [Bradyrhizobium elkanii]